MVARTLKLAVFGDPVAHSLSPLIHRQFARQTGIRIEYRRIRARAGELADRMRAFARSGGDGANITLPHKQAVIEHCRELTARARRAAAVNTLKREEQGWLGDNTDGAGLIRDLQRLGLLLEGAAILIIGAGGAARGILPALLDERPERILIVNRNADRARAVVAELGDERLAAGGLRPAYREPFNLLIHATAAGHGKGPLPLPERIAATTFCYDLGYGAASQAFRGWAGARGLAHADGLGMLVGQAAESFRLWSGVSIPPTDQARILQQLHSR